MKRQVPSVQNSSDFPTAGHPENVLYETQGLLFESVFVCTP